MDNEAVVSHLLRVVEETMDSCERLWPDHADYLVGTATELLVSAERLLLSVPAASRQRVSLQAATQRLRARLCSFESRHYQVRPVPSPDVARTST